MPTYVLLINYTQQGIQSFKEGASRLDEGKQALEEVGGKFIAYYLLMGQYDEMVILEAPDDETLAKILLTIAKAGNVRTETLRAFTEGEYRNIAAALD